MDQPIGARHVVKRFLEVTAAFDTEDVLKLYADDVVVEFPFALTGPRRLEGRETVRNALAKYDSGPLVQETRFENLVIHETTDPEVFVAEFDVAGRITSTGRTFNVPSIQVVRVRDGRILLSRNYHNDLARAHAAGMAEQMLAAFTSSAAAEDSR